jgi:peroxiredoxin (alkyl hydroperoxide reductase subunit C)|nr:peroxiredoxin [Candidatus Methylopumilus sp.]
VHDNAIARDVKETLRKLKAAQYVANNPGQVCPAKWQEGAKTIAPSLDLVGKI